MCLLTIAQFYHLYNLTNTRDETSSNNIHLPENLKIASNKAASATVQCDATPCDGFFAYDPPNHNSADSFQYYAFDRYRHAGKKEPDSAQTDIFMPKVGFGADCVQEWKEARKDWAVR